MFKWLYKKKGCAKHMNNKLEVIGIDHGWSMMKTISQVFVTGVMPSYKTKQVDEQGKPIYQDVCYPVTKDFREKLYNEIISEYEKAKDKSNEKARESAEKHHGNPDKEKDKEATPFR